VSQDAAHKSQKEYELAVGLMQEQNVPGTFQHLFRALELDPTHADTHLMLGNLFLLRQETKRAEHHLREAIKYRGRFPEARNSLGVLYINQANYAQAIKELRVATSDLLNREPHLAWGNLGLAYYKMKKYRDAEDSLRQSVRMQPKFCVGFLRLGETYMAQKRFEDAQQALTSALEVPEPQCQQMQEVWHLRGLARVQMNHHDQAIEDFERCVEIAAQSTVGRDCRSYLDAAH